MVSAVGGESSIAGERERTRSGVASVRLAGSRRSLSQLPLPASDKVIAAFPEMQEEKLEVFTKNMAGLSTIDVTP
jgi:hypothetical protein